MKKKNLITIAVITIIVIVVGVIFTQLQNSPSGLSLPFGSSVSGEGQTSADVARGNQLYATGDLEGAFNAYSMAIEAGEDLANAYAGRGNVYTSWRRFIEAEIEYSASLEYERQPGVLASRCNVYRLLAKFDLAIIDCQETIELDPEFIDGYIALTLLHLEQGDLDSAATVIDEALQIAPESAIINYTYGQVVRNQGKFEQAIEAYSEAIRLDPTEPQFYWDRGFTYYMTGQLGLSKADMQSVIDNGTPEIHGELIYQAGSLMNSMSGVP
jgi:tetratricopeptide (TPR) repeat protein